MTLLFSRADFGRLLPSLLLLWPNKEEEWQRTNQAKVIELSMASRQRHASSGDSDLICISTEISKKQLEEAGLRVAALRSVPWKYRKFFEDGRPTLRSAIKIRPGVMLPLTINGVDTTARVNTARRIHKGGKSHFLKMDITLNTEYLPVILERETRCNCVYCGTKAASDEVNCRACGAPLPSGC